MINKKTGLIALLASFAAGEMMAGNLTTYNPGGGNVLICFRKSADLVVDAGPISTYTGYAANSVHTISDYTASQLTSGIVSANVNGLFWGAFTWQSDNTLYMSAPRGASSLSVQANAWIPSTAEGQSLTILRLAKIVVGAKAEFAYDGASTTSAIITEDNSVNNLNFNNGSSYRDAIFGQTSQAFFNNTFQGVVEQKTPDGFGAANKFATGGKVQRADFYQLTPGAANAVWLGYFELNTNGVMSYVAYPSTQPVIQSISRSGNQTTINYTAGIYGTYTLRKNTSLNSGTPFASWTSVSTLTAGDTASHSITFTDTNDNSFYTITAQ